MEGITATTAAEVIGIIYNTETSLVCKIPYKVLEFFNDESLKCEERDNLIEQISENPYSVSDEAKAIIALIYKDYLCESEEERKKLNDAFVESRKEFERQEQEKYNPFKDVENTINNENLDNTEIIKTTEALVLPSKKWYVRLLDKIKSFFK